MIKDSGIIPTTTAVQQQEGNCCVAASCAGELPYLVRVASYGCANWKLKFHKILIILC